MNLVIMFYSLKKEKTEIVNNLIRPYSKTSSIWANIALAQFTNAPLMSKRILCILNRCIISL